MPPKYATPEDKSRVTSSQAKNSDTGNISKDSFGSRFQSAADKNTNSGKTNN